MLEIVKGLLKMEEEIHAGNKGYFKEEVFVQMSKEVSIIVDQTIKTLEVSEEDVIILEVKQFVKKIAKAKMRNLLTLILGQD